MSADPTNIAAAATAATIASAIARAAEGGTLPFPPNNLPALRSIPGVSAMNRAHVLGYVVMPQIVNDCIAPDGAIKIPGDAGFREAQEGRLGVIPMPKGWMFEERKVSKLFAVVDGNPILLEQQAKNLGYYRALATGANTLDLGEIEVG